MAYVEASVRRTQLIAAARAALGKHGVTGTSLRVVAAEAGVPLGTLQYVFPSKEELLRAVIESVVSDISQVLEQSAEVDKGLAHAIRRGVSSFWPILVEAEPDQQMMQLELTLDALRSNGHGDLATWQYEKYAGIVATWCRKAAARSGEKSAVPYEQLGRLIVAGVDGLIVQYLCDPNPRRAKRDLKVFLDMVVGLALPRAK